MASWLLTVVHRLKDEITIVKRGWQYRIPKIYEARKPIIDSAGRRWHPAQIALQLLAVWDKDELTFRALGPTAESSLRAIDEFCRLPACPKDPEPMPDWDALQAEHAPFKRSDGRIDLDRIVENAPDEVKRRHPLSIASPLRSGELESEIEIINRNGLDLRGAGWLTSIARDLGDEIALVKNGYSVTLRCEIDASGAPVNQIIGVLALAIARGDRIRVRARGSTAAHSMEVLKRFFVRGLPIAADQPGDHCIWVESGLLCPHEASVEPLVMFIPGGKTGSLWVRGTRHLTHGRIREAT